MARPRMRRPRRSTVIAAEAVLAIAAAAVAVQSTSGYVVAAVALVFGLVLLVRRRGRGLLDVVRGWFRDPVEPLAAENPAGSTLGLAADLVPGLHVVDVATRDGHGLGVVGDGQGFVVLLGVDVGAPRTWAFADMIRILTEDPARPAAVQLLVEQSGPGRGGGDPDFGPSRTYRSLPVRGLPLWNRVLLVIRHEPAWAPETADARGGGAEGARKALAAVAARTVAAAARDGITMHPADAHEAATLLRELGDPAPDATVVDTAVIGTAWISTGATLHMTMSVPLQDEGTIGAVLRAAAELDVDRCVLSVTANAIDHSACAAIRLVAGEQDVLAAASDRLVADGLAVPLPRAQAAGLVATLPLGGGARSLADLVNQERL